MAEEPSWDDIFRPAGAEPTRPVTPAAPAGPEPVSTAFPTARLSDPFAVAAAEAQAAQSAPADPNQPASRRAAREAEATANTAGRGSSRGGAPRGRTSGSGRGSQPPKKKRRLGWLWALLIVVALIAGGGIAGWVMFEPQIRHVLGWEAPIDYTTTGNGTKVTVVIQSGDIGSDVAKTLQQAGVPRRSPPSTNYCSRSRT